MQDPSEFSKVETNKASGKLYVVATPIGNLEDISLRAITVLKEVDVIAAEDSRHSARLLDHLSISTHVITLHEHNEREKSVALVKRMAEGQNIALISDAGTPLISDPGYRMVREARLAGIGVVPVPGACAVIAALSVSGLPTDRFLFAGFLPSRQEARKNVLKPFINESATVVFYEAPHRIVASLEDLVDILGPDRQAVIAREMTKTFETILSGKLGILLECVKEDKNQQRGEIVILLHGADSSESDQDVSAEVQNILEILLEDHSVKQAAALAARITGEKKNKLYQLALAIEKR